MRALIVEDDQFKLDALKGVLGNAPGIKHIESARSVQSAIRSITQKQFDLLILDMSLPSHDLETASGLGIPRLSGGIEVLFEIQYQGKDMRTIIVTQYPEIELENRMVPIEEVGLYLCNAFEIEVDCCLFFDFENDGWSTRLKERIQE